MVRLPEDKPSLEHYAPSYDPTKAHEYYLKTRKLHPRQKGMQRPVSTRTGATRPAHLIPPVAAQQLARQRAQAAAAVTSLENKLKELKTALARKKAALNRDKKSQKPTAADKAKSARESKQYRQKHKSELAAKAKRDRARRATGGSATKRVINNPGSGSIKQVEAAIQTVQTALTAAKARQKALG